MSETHETPEPADANAMIATEAAVKSIAAARPATLRRQIEARVKAAQPNAAIVHVFIVCRPDFGDPYRNIAHDFVVLVDRQAGTWDSASKFCTWSGTTRVPGSWEQNRQLPDTSVPFSVSLDHGHYDLTLAEAKMDFRERCERLTHSAMGF